MKITKSLLDLDFDDILENYEENVYWVEKNQEKEDFS
jgi:hypothetical protein